MFVRPSSYFLETKKKYRRQFLRLYVSAVYAVVRLSLCHVRVEHLLCQNIQPHSQRHSGAPVPPGVSQIFPPREKIHPPPCKIYACSGGLLLAPINALHLYYRAMQCIA